MQLCNGICKVLAHNDDNTDMSWARVFFFPIVVVAVVVDIINKSEELFLKRMLHCKLAV